MKITVPDTAAKARKRIIEIDTLENLGKWEKAAICYAFRAECYDRIGDMRAAEQAAADELNTEGYSAWTIHEYAGRWQKAGLADIRPGNEVEIPGMPWEPIQGGSNGDKERGVNESMTRMVVESAKSDPEIAAVLVDAIVGDDDHTIENAIEKSRVEEREAYLPHEKEPVGHHLLRYMLKKAISLLADYKAEGEVIPEVETLVHQFIETARDEEDKAAWDQALADLLASVEGGE